MTRPRVFMDVDGVINACTFTGPFPTHWPEDGWTRSECRGFVITWHAEVARALRTLDEQGHADFVWLTTWEAEANAWITPLLGTREWPALERRDPRFGPGWGKLTRVQEAWEQDQRPFVWVDDHIRYYPAAVEWLQSLPEGACCVICPDEEDGLTADQLAAVTSFLDEHAEAAA